MLMLMLATLWNGSLGLSLSSSTDSASPTAIFATFSLSPPASSSPVQYGGVWLSPRGKFQYVVSDDPTTLHSYYLVAWGSFEDSIEENGWSTLDIHTNASFTEEQQAQGAGYLEGALTVQRTSEYMLNVFNNKMSGKVLGFVKANTAWVKQQIAKNPSDSYWFHLNLLYLQVEGAYQGYAATVASDPVVDFDTYYAATLMGDLDDLCTIFSCDPELLRPKGDGHCSVLIKLLPGNTELLTGHTTWGSFEMMTRIYKRYDFPWRISPTDDNIVPSRHIAFPSYPATFTSVDDFYTTAPSNLAVLETTLANNNDALWDYVRPQTVLEWARVFLATRLTNSGPQWVETFRQHNSGTYNNQWMVVDYKLFTSGVSTSEMSPGILTVVEQMPGPYIVTADLTQRLAQTSNWVSYNRAFFPEIYNISNQWKLYDWYGDHYSYSQTARAQIFARYQGNVTDEESYRKVMRYNDFFNDPIGTQGCRFGPSGSNAIAERGDLTPIKSFCISDIGPIDEVAYDLKYTSKAMMTGNSEVMSVMAQSGPTWDPLPVFSWSTASRTIRDVRHQGQPDVWNFPFVKFTFSVANNDDDQHSKLPPLKLSPE